jgi:hypothetical protein
MDVPTLRQREGLVAVRLRAEKGAELIKDVTETCSHRKGFEPSSGSEALLHSPMVLLQMVVEIAVGPVHHLVAKDGSDGTRVGVMAIRGDPLGRHTSHRPGRTEARLGCRKIPRGAQPDIHELAIPINGPVEILPLALNTHIGVIDIPAVPHRAMASLA